MARTSGGRGRPLGRQQVKGAHRPAERAVVPGQGQQGPRGQEEEEEEEEGVRRPCRHAPPSGERGEAGCQSLSCSLAGSQWKTSLGCRGLDSRTQYFR